MSIWTAQYEVVNIDTEHDILEGDAGAFVNVYGLFETVTEFITTATKTLSDVYGLGTVGLIDIESITQVELDGCDEAIQDLVNELSSERPVVPGSFHSYELKE